MIFQVIHRVCVTKYAISMRYKLEFIYVCRCDEILWDFYDRKEHAHELSNCLYELQTLEEVGEYYFQFGLTQTIG